MARDSRECDATWRDRVEDIFIVENLTVADHRHRMTNPLVFTCDISRRVYHRIATPRRAQRQTSGVCHASPSRGTKAARQNSPGLCGVGNGFCRLILSRVVGGVVRILAVNATPSGKGAVAMGKAIGGISRAVVARLGFMLGRFHVRIFTPGAGRADRSGYCCQSWGVA